MERHTFTALKPTDGSLTKMDEWTYANKVWRHTILCMISNELFNVYYSLCRKPSDHAPHCKKRIKRDNKSAKPNLNLVEVNDIIIVVISQVNLMVDVQE